MVRQAFYGASGHTLRICELCVFVRMRPLRTVLMGLFCCNEASLVLSSNDGIHLFVLDKVEMRLKSIRVTETTACIFAFTLL